MIEINKIYNEDCSETMARMPDKYCNVIITSPPYNFDAGSGIGHKYDFKSKGYKDNLTQDDYFVWQSKCIKEMLRVSELVFYNIQMIAGNKDALFKIMGAFYNKIKELIIWDKTTAEPAINDNVLNSQYEFILVFSDNNKRKFDRAYFKKGTLSNVFYIKKYHNWRNEIFEDHKALFPPDLPAKIINNFTKENDIVYDPFMGLGTTALVCIKTKRNYIGSEINPNYCETIDKRIQQELSQLKLAI